MAHAAKTSFVCQLSYEKMKALGDVLDPGCAWEVVAQHMPGIAVSDVNACRQVGERHYSPTEELIRIWGSKGATVSQLYKVFYKAKNTRAMDVIKDTVDPRYHTLQEQLLQQNDVLHVGNNCAAFAHSSGSGNALTVQQSTPQATAGSIRSGTMGQQQAQETPSYGTNYNKVSISCSAGSKTTQRSSLYSLATSAQQVSLSSTNATLNRVESTPGLQNTLAVSYGELQLATNDFNASNVIGRGGYGVVYRGLWKHTDVAVKRIQSKSQSGLEQDKERLRQCLMEMKTLSVYRHDNILPLYSYSLDGPEPCLVYQFMAGGSLEDRLLCRNHSAPLSWSQRLYIAAGTSKGLLFLHTIESRPLIHGDVKSANILLDKHLEPKLGDFGLARIGQLTTAIDARPLVASHIKGTLAYLPPEFITSKHLSAKLDVYSFGVVLLEMASGLRAYSDSRRPHSIVDYVRELRRKETVDHVFASHLADKRVLNTSNIAAGIGNNSDNNEFDNALASPTSCRAAAAEVTKEYEAFPTNDAGTTTTTTTTNITATNITIATATNITTNSNSGESALRTTTVICEASKEATPLVLLRIGLLCCDREPSNRPEFDCVVKSLS